MFPTRPLRLISMNSLQDKLVVVVVLVIAKLATGLRPGFVEFNVLDYGAVGDGTTDDSQAFLKAWEDACASSKAGTPLLFAPGRKRYLLNPTRFNGPCKSSRINFQMKGKILAPENPGTWNGLDRERWLSFKHADGLTVWGDAVVDGRGQQWWAQSCSDHPENPDCTNTAPTAMEFLYCEDLKLTGIKVVNSQQMHIGLLGCDRASLSRFTIDSPGDSPNTDGVHLQNSTNVTISHASIHSGDDCISIGNKVFDVNITNIFCGPGHGISIGSLGKDGSQASVERINVQFVQFVNTTNGARIKTWQGGKGLVKSILFENINVTNVENPIVINQYYCLNHGSCPPMAGGVEISDVWYRNIVGTSMSPVAVSLNCSSTTIGCSSITLDSINLTSSEPDEEVTSVCINAHGDAQGIVNPSVPCLE